MTRANRGADAAAPARPVIATAGEPLLSVRNLTVEIPTEHGILRIIDNVGLELRRGEITGLVGESGSGKTMTARAIMGLVPSEQSRITGSVRLEGRELVGL
jgi:peptide/nickel transport system ATP-binding protein